MYMSISADMHMHSNTLSGNEASSDGGAIYADDVPRMIADNNDLINNDAVIGGGVFIQGGEGSAFLSNSFLKNNATYGIGNSAV